MSTMPPRPTLTSYRAGGRSRRSLPSFPLHAGPQVVHALGLGGAPLVRGRARDRHHALAEGGVAGAGARFDERLPLPGLGLLGLVAGKGLERDDEQAVASRGAQARVQLVARPLAVRGPQEPQHALRDAGEPLGSVLVARRLVDEEQVQVGSVAELAPAELSHADEREPEGLFVPALAHGEAHGMLERRIGEGRQNVGDVAHRHVAGKVRQPHLERHPPLRAAQRADEVVDVGLRADRTDLLVELHADGLGRRNAARVDHAIDEIGVTGKRLAEEGAGAEQGGKRAHEVRIVGQRAQIDAGRRQPGEERREQTRSLFGVRCVGQRAQQRTDEGRLPVARGRPQRCVWTPRERQQVAGQIGRGRGPELRERCRGDRSLVPRVQRGGQSLEHRVVLGAGFAQRGKADRDRLSHLLERPSKRGRAREPQRTGHARDHVGGVRQRVRLQACGELDAMLEAPQKQVGVRQLGLLALGDEAAGAQPSQAVQRVGCAHAGIPPSPDQLQPLREELDLADAAGADSSGPRATHLLLPRARARASTTSPRPSEGRRRVARRTATAPRAAAHRSEGRPRRVARARAPHAPRSCPTSRSSARPQRVR